MKENRERLRENILTQITGTWGISRAHLLGPGKPADVVAARKAAASLLKSSGFTVRRIAEILKRDRSTIEYYLDMRTKARVLQRLPASLKSLPPDVADIITSISRSCGETPEQIVSDWIADRARREQKVGITRRVAVDESASRISH